jgi:hypothetical protein
VGSKPTIVVLGTPAASVTVRIPVASLVNIVKRRSRVSSGHRRELGAAEMERRPPPSSKGCS